MHRFIALAILAVGLASAQHSDCLRNGGAWCASNPTGNGVCYYPDQQQFCCGSNTATPAQCGGYEGQQCCSLEGVAGCCEDSQTCCFNYQSNMSTCANAHTESCCPKDVSAATGHGVCPNYCSTMTESVCKSSWGKTRNCSWSSEEFSCYDNTKYTACENATSLRSDNFELCDKEATCCKGNNGNVMCCPSGSTCQPDVAQLCIPKNPSCSFWEESKDKCLESTDCAYCGTCYNKSSGNVNCCAGKGDAQGAICGSFSTCCSKGTSASGQAACCESGTQCCEDITFGVNQSTSTCVYGHCCPKAIQIKYGRVNCHKTCSEIQQKDLCTDATWNPDCVWAGPANTGLCYNKNNSPCTGNKTVCNGDFGSVCCDADETCAWGVRCVKKSDYSKPCSHWDERQNSCEFFQDCYYCMSSSSCVNTTAGQCCSDKSCSDGSCCQYNPSGCCGEQGMTTCCMYENSKCCKTTSGQGYCCNQLDACAMTSEKKCVKMTDAPSSTAAALKV